MDYVTLDKLFYKDKTEYEKEYERRLNSPWTVKLDFNIGDNPAFFVVTPEISQLVASILRTDKAIAQIKTRLPVAALNHFQRRCLIDEILLTNDIEGVYSTRKEISDIVDSADKEAPEKSIHKRLYGLSMKYVMLSNEHIPMKSCEDIRNIFDELVLPEVINDDPTNMPDGELFRKGSVSIQSVTQKEIHRGLYPEQRIHEAMDKALAFIADENIEPLFRTAIFHYLFEYIHPFYDGNGRCGRFICSYMLAQNLDPLMGVRLSYTIKENIKQYYDAFKICNDPKSKGELTPFLLTSMTFFKISADNLYQGLDQREKMLNSIMEESQQHLHGKDKLYKDLFFTMVQASLFAEKGISMAALQAELDASGNAIRGRLNEFDSRILKVEKDGNKKLYSFDMDELTSKFE